MAAEIALFLREPVPDAVLLPALAEVFDADPDEELTVVDYAEGFATGIGAACAAGVDPDAAARRLAGLLRTEVLLETAAGGMSGEQWRLYPADGGPARAVRVVALRGGLCAIPELGQAPGAAYAVLVA
ncbi:MAG TPA: hypothetical protein VEC01_09590 [Noviherbaspirillum sp.]|uniref:hypothetical protein n=1 Tax=Noviherbaspirillum sp. TaxID=1926288 RepID=UPI002D403B11|nr:hypothetical protein [Noviherbaspirillum sp.]HYD95563.1 hypothetical protein [Noviherbaspirillum sp.]